MEASNTYGQKILAIYKTILAVNVADDEIEKYFPTKVDEPTVEAKPVEPEVEEPKVEDKAPEIAETVTPEISDDEQIEEKADTLATLIFNCFKKLIKMFAELFNK